jgi:hypothetical protein
MAAHRYWSIYIIRTEGRGGNFGLAELEAYETHGGPNLATASIASLVGSTVNFGSFADIFDGNGSTGAQISGDGGMRIVLDFGSGNDKDITEWGLFTSPYSSTRGPGEFVTEHSDDGSTWTTQFWCLATGWVIGTRKSFIGPVEDRTARYWNFNRLYSGGLGLQLSEFEFRTAIGVTRTPTGGTPSATSEPFGSTFGADKACDANTSTRWATSDDDCFWAYDFGSGNDCSVVEVTITSNASAINSYPRSFNVGYSDDGITYVLTDVFPTTGTWGTAPYQKVFTLSAPPDPTISQSLTLDYKIQLQKSLTLDYRVLNFIEQSMTLDYKIQLQKSLILDYALPELFNFFYAYPMIDRTTSELNVQNFDLTCAPFGEALTSGAEARSAPDHFVGDDAPAFFENNFYGDFYLRIWLDPALRSLSNPRINVPIAFNVWNTFDHPNTLLETIMTDLPGVELGYTMPVAFDRYEYKTLTFSIGTDAPPELNGTMDLIFNYGQAQLRLIATIIEVMRALPNEPIQETWIWKNTVNIFKASKEQRASMRSRPRIGMSYPTFLDHDAGRKAHYAQLWTFVARTIRVPMFQYAVVLDAEAIVGDTKLYFDPTKTDLRADEYLVLYNPADDSLKLAKTLTIDVDGATLSNPLDENIGEAWKVVPTIDMRLAASSGLAMDAVNGEATINAESTQGRDLQRPGSTAAIATFDGLPVIPDRPVTPDSQDDRFDQNPETVDNGSSVPSVYTFWPMPFVSGARQWLIDRETDVDYWRLLCDTLRGQQNPFYLPTWREDLNLYETPTLGSVTIRVVDTDFPNMLANNVYKQLQIVSANGVIYRSVISAIDLGVGYVEVILNAPIGSTSGDEDILAISFLNLCRLNSDEVRLSHYVGYSVIELDIRTVNE